MPREPLPMTLLDSLKAGLPKHHFRILKLRYVDLLSQKQIASRTGLSQAAVSKAIANAIRVASAIAGRPLRPQEPAQEPPKRAVSALDLR